MLPYFRMHTGVPSSLCVLWTVVPKQAHHQLSCGTDVGGGGGVSTCFHCSVPRPKRHWFPTCLRLLPQGGDLGHVRQGLLPGPRLQQNGVPHLNQLAVPLDALEARPQHGRLFSLRTQKHAESPRQRAHDKDVLFTLNCRNVNVDGLGLK